MSSSDYLVLCAKGYDFVNRETGEHLSGINVYYLDLLMSDYQDGMKGLAPLKVSCTPRVLEQLTVVPGFYDLNFRQKPGTNGKPTLVLADAKFQGALNLEPKQVVTKVS